MAAGTSPIFEQVVSIGAPKTFTSADTTAKKTIASGDTDGTRIDMVMVSSDDTAAVNLMFYITLSGTDYFIGNVNIPIGSGYTTVARVDAMATLSPVLGYLAIPSGADLKCACLATMTAAKTLTVVPMGGDYS
jgi:hypothetical protein